LCSIYILFFLQYVKVIFEIGHEASVRNKRTPEGFTHDWELFVRGADNTDIHFFIDKVVFHLHDTFPNPKRGKCFFFKYILLLNNLNIGVFFLKYVVKTVFKHFFM